MQFKTETIEITGPISYRTIVTKFCCKAMRRAFYCADYVYDGRGVRLWGESDYLNQCPYCGSR